jgi:hypothetical protein
VYFARLAGLDDQAAQHGGGALGGRARGVDQRMGNVTGRHEKQERTVDIDPAALEQLAHRDFGEATACTHVSTRACTRERERLRSDC